MFLTISNLLSPEQSEAVQAQLDLLTWTVGVKTAGAMARRVKHNEQADLADGIGPGLHRRLSTAISQHPVLRAAAQPKAFSRLMVSRTGTGGGYGPHIDNALMHAEGGRIRSDLSFTLFLSDPETYQGGELRIGLPGGVQSVKLSVGDLVLYPSSTIHEVAPVIGGTRIVCVGWIESHIREAERREILFDLENLRAELQAKAAGFPEHLVLDKTIANLMRLWAST